MMLQQNPCCMAKPNKSFFNVLRRSKKSFEKAATSRIIDLFMKDFYFNCLEVDTDSYYSQKIWRCNFRYKLIGITDLLGLDTHWFQNTRFYQSPILIGFAIQLISHLEYFILKTSIIILL